ncbi:hypothetical protein [Mycobacterium canetti]|uniref:hypothetical protein n=1 Tax=Mycobacterium canetti TaxID=78331 RepID=UPI0013144B6A|nr:hypothetical protein [Mycobacterium canetti]
MARLPDPRHRSGDPPTDPAWAHSEPTVNAAKLVANNTPYLGVFGQRHALGGVERQ